MSKSKKLNESEKSRRAESRARDLEVQKAETRKRNECKRLAKQCAAAVRKAEKRANSAYGHFERAMTPWTPAELAVYGTVLDRGIGPSEPASALSEGLELVVKGRKHANDLANGMEDKSVQGQKESLIPFRAGADAIRKERRALAECVRWLERQVPATDDERLCNDKTFNYIIDGLKSDWRQCLPVALGRIYDSFLGPINGLSEYFLAGIKVTTRKGWILIPGLQFEKALQLCAVSKGYPKYSLRKEWLVSLPSYSHDRSSTNQKTG